MSKKSPSALFWWVFVAVVALDQLSKYFFSRFVSLNYGVAFGISLFGFLNWLGLALVLGVMFGLFLDLIARYPVGLGLFYSGAVSNLVDRLVFGGVRDFLPLPFGLTNNLADWAIGMGLVCVVILKVRDEVAKRSESQSS